MYRARDRVEHEEWIARIHRGADALDLGGEAKSNAANLFLSHVPEQDRSKPAVAAASLYAAALIAGEERSQAEVAGVMDVARLSIQTRWKGILRETGFEPPEW